MRGSKPKKSSKQAEYQRSHVLAQTMGFRPTPTCRGGHVGQDLGGRVSGPCPPVGYKVQVQGSQARGLRATHTCSPAGFRGSGGQGCRVQREARSGVQGSEGGGVRGAGVRGRRGQGCRD